MTEKQKQRAYATRMEHINLNGKKALHKKWKNIASELSDREITLKDICNPDSPKQLGLLEMAKSQKMSLGDLTILRQYSEAIVNGSTKAAEFIRDTMGEKPTTQLDVNTNESGIKNMSEAELREMLELLRKGNVDN
jgi:hypothetical protein